MFCSSTLNHIINRLHARAIRIAYDEYSSDFEALLDTIPVHKRKLKTLVIEMYKILNNLSPLLMRDMMTEICVPYNARSTTEVNPIQGG